ncbi:MAG: hypothetical protein AAGK25_00010 [Pseudomonadota bacterium]
MDNLIKRQVRHDWQFSGCQDLVDRVLKIARDPDTDIDVLDKALRMLSPGMAALNIASSIDDKIVTRIEKAEARRAALTETAQDIHNDDSRAAKQPSLDQLLEETARFAHSRLASGGLSKPPNADAPGDSTPC